MNKIFPLADASRKALPLLLVVFVSVCSGLWGSEADFDEAIRLFRAKKYAEALPLLKELARKGDKAAMYRLGYLYEKGLGVRKNPAEAMKWYKKAAHAYAYAVAEKPENADLLADAFTQRLAGQFAPESVKISHEEALAKIDTQTKETRNIVWQMTEDFFGLEPYKTNYFLPLACATRKYRRQPSGYRSFAVADAVEPLQNGYSREAHYGTYDEKCEVEFQFSLKKNLTYNLFGFHEYITAAYTQRSFWQLYSPSGPFRETNYMPEVFALFPTSRAVDRATGLKVSKWGFIHQSNGQEGYRSRSWNRLYLEGLFQWNNLFLKPRVWYRLPESDKSDDYYRGYVDLNHNGRPDPEDRLVDPNAESDRDDNPDILDYMGYGDLSLTWLWHEHQIGALVRYNFGRGGRDRGAVQVDWSYPFFGSSGTFWYMKFFNGYGESLIDYNRHVTKASFGFSFSRGLFQ